MVYFFNRIIDAITSFSFYQQLVSIPFSKILKVYLLFVFLFSIIRSIPFLTTTLPLINERAGAVLSELSQVYPADLTFTWDGKMLTSSQPQLTVPYPTSWPQNTSFTKDTKYIAQIDTSVEKATPSSDAFVTISQKEITLPASEAGQNMLELSSILEKPFTITKQTITELPAQWEGLKSSFLSGVVIGTPIALFVLLLVQRLLTALIEASLFYVFRYFLRSTWNFATAYKYTLAFFIPAEIIDFAAQVMYPQHNFSFFTLTAWIYFIAITFYPGFRRWQSLQREQ